MNENTKKWAPWALAGLLALSCLVLVPVGVGVGYWMGKPPAGIGTKDNPLPIVADPKFKATHKN